LTTEGPEDVDWEEIFGNEGVRYQCACVKNNEQRTKQIELHFAIARPFHPKEGHINNNDYVNLCCSWFHTGGIYTLISDNAAASATKVLHFG
jgi:hypothetical protein